MTERFFVKEKIKEGQKEIILHDVAQIHQITKVLRKKHEDILFILDNSGNEYKCKIKQTNHKLLLLEVLESFKNNNEPEMFVSLFQSILKKDKMEFVFEKCTELGVSEFNPIVSENSVKLSLKEERAGVIIKEATEQSQRGIIPKLNKIIKFKQALDICEPNDLNIIFHEKNNDILTSILKGKDIQKYKKINIFVGPEGGFSENEIKLAKEKGFLIASLGKRVLRGETAAIAASTMLLLDK